MEYSKMEDKITIIEGPPPTFEVTSEGWVLGLSESPILSDIALTRLRTYNGSALVERCYRAWKQNKSIHLEFKDQDGLEYQAPIAAARYVETDDGQMLFLWVRLDKEEVELEIDFDDDLGDEIDDDFGSYPI
jgi:hypothetical protein